MAILNGMYIHVTRESMEREVSSTSHPVEEGVPTTDIVKAKALSINLSGKIVDYGDVKASKVLSQLQTWHANGTIVTYRGRNIASSMQIRTFQTDHPNTNSGGADFTMTLKQVRIAKSAYVPKTTTQTEKKDIAITVGMKVIFTGGPVYVSSDATKSAATRGRSTCEVTKISTQSWSVHQYHLISTDGGKVYGWVDKANIEGTETTSTNGKTNAGTQQVKSGNSSAVYHTVKRGDTVWGLINSKYSYLDKTCQWVLDNNPTAFSRKGDATTLQIGAKLLMGYK